MSPPMSWRMIKVEIVKRVFLTLLIFGTILSPLSLLPLYVGFGGETKEITIDNGVIDDKRLVEYNCGVKNDSVCIDYVLSINGVEYIVDESVFSSKTVKQKVKLTSFESIREPYLWEIILALYSITCLCVVGGRVLSRGVMWFHWCFISDTKLTFKEWTNT